MDKSVHSAVGWPHQVYQAGLAVAHSIWLYNKKDTVHKMLQEILAKGTQQYSLHYILKML